MMFLSKGRFCPSFCPAVLELCFCISEAPQVQVHLSDGLKNFLGLYFSMVGFVFSCKATSPFFETNTLLFETKTSLEIDETKITGSTAHETELTEFKGVFDKALTVSESLSSSSVQSSTKTVSAHVVEALDLFSFVVTACLGFSMLVETGTFDWFTGGGLLKTTGSRGGV